MADKPERLGKYTLSKKLAAGGMAEVFLAKDDAGRRCVIKRVLPTLLVDPQFARMFLDEAKLVVQLNHPGIAQIHDFGQDNGVLFLAMEWVDGTNLRTIVKDFARRGALIPVEYCARLVAQAALALGYAHRAVGLDGRPLKIIHRDVSPQNILLGHTGAVKLIDFGVAKATSATQRTAAGMIKGKFAYMSPEQLRGNPLDGRSDIFGLGLVLYELLAAERAIPGASDAEIAQNALELAFPPIKLKRPDIPSPLEAILGRALARDRDQRYDTAEQLAAELETFINPRMASLCAADLAKLLPAMEVAAPPSSSPAAPKPTRQPSGSPVPRQDSTASSEVSTLDVPPARGPITVPHLPALKDGGAPRVASEAFLTPVAYEDLPRTVINPPGLIPKPVAGLPTGRAPIRPATIADVSEVVLNVAPRSGLRWFIGATVAGIVLAALGWMLGTRGTEPPAELAAPAPVDAKQPKKAMKAEDTRSDE